MRGLEGRWSRQARKKPQHKATVSALPLGTQGSVTGGSGEEEGLEERKFPLGGPTPRHPQPARGQVKRDRALLQVAGQRRGWGKARQQWHFYLGLLGSERVGGGGGGRRPGRGGGDRPQHLATHLLLLNPVRAERWVGGGGLTRSRGWGTPPLGPWPGLEISRSRSQRDPNRDRTPDALGCALESRWDAAGGVALVGKATTTCRPTVIPGSRLSGGLAAARGLPGDTAGPAVPSRLGAAGEPGAPHTSSRQPRGRPLPAGRLEPCAAPACTQDLPSTPTTSQTRSSTVFSPHPTPHTRVSPRPGTLTRWHNPSLFVGGGAEPGAAALSQPTDPIKYYLCLKIPVIGYAAAFSEPRAKRSKNSQSGRSYFHHANSHFL